MADSPLLLFVFGTLRRGEPNHGYLAGNYERWLAAELPGFAREITPHGFPAAVPAPGGRISGELFFLGPGLHAEILARCDALEDIPPGQLVGKYYRRARVRVETAEGELIAWAYVDPRTSDFPA